MEPRFNQLIEKDPQIVKVDLDYTDFGSRKSGLPGSIKNQRTIKHVRST
jgi:hypothetical protein